MIHALERHEFSRVRTMARKDPLNCAAAAVVDGHSPGQVWVDDPAAPSAALIDTPEGHYLLGDSGDGSFARALQDLILETLGPGGPGEHWWWFYLRCGSQEWTKAMQEVLPAARTAEEPREFYLCEHAPAGPPKLPAGYELVRVDRRLLQRDDVENIDRIRRAETSSFGSIDAFLEKGFAFAVRHADELVSWNVCDCVSGARAEIGIHTIEGHRRRGLAAAVVDAAVRWALSNGFDSVGWHNHTLNTASAATARKAGFRKARDYTAFKVCVRPADADVLKATAALIQHQFDEAAALYRQAFQAIAADPICSYLLSSRQDQAKYAWMAACAHALSERHEAGTEFLDEAIDLAGIRQGGY